MIYKSYGDAAVIVLLNTSYTMDVSELAEEGNELFVDAILWVGGVGQVGCLEAVKILEGKVNPSGRLPADSCASRAGYGELAKEM